MTDVQLLWLTETQLLVTRGNSNTKLWLTYFHIWFQLLMKGLQIWHYGSFGPIKFNLRHYHPHFPDEKMKVDIAMFPEQVKSQNHKRLSPLAQSQALYPCLLCHYSSPCILKSTLSVWPCLNPTWDFRPPDYRNIHLYCVKPISYGWARQKGRIQSSREGVGAVFIS